MQSEADVRERLLRYGHALADIVKLSLVGEELDDHIFPVVIRHLSVEALLSREHGPVVALDSVILDLPLEVLALGGQIVRQLRRHGLRGNVAPPAADELRFRVLLQIGGFEAVVDLSVQFQPGLSQVLFGGDGCLLDARIQKVD